MCGASGSNAVVRSWDGSLNTELTKSLTPGFTGIFGRDANSILVTGGGTGGNNANTYYYDGQSWSQVIISGGATMLSVWGPPSIVPSDEPPRLINLDPSPEATDIEATRGIRFSITASNEITFSTIQIWINDTVAFLNNAWQNDFTGIYNSNVSINGYDFLVISPTEWGEEQRVKVNVQAKDVVLLEMDETYYFSGPSNSEQPFSTYSMLMRSIRMHDQRSPGLLKFICEEGFDDVWKRTIFDRTSELKTLFDPYKIDARWLPWLKSLVALTRDFHFQATEEELRRVIALAVEMWNDKPSESSIADAIRMTTGNRFSIRNFFDLRFEGDVARVTEELKDFDPNVLLFSWENFIEGDRLRTCDASSTYPCNATFYIRDAIPPFIDTKQYTHLLIYDHPEPELDGLYEIDFLYPYDWTRQGLIKSSFPVQTASTGPWKLLNPNSDMTTEVRLVDKGVALIPFRNETAAFSHGLGNELIYGETSKAKAWAMGVTYEGSDKGNYLVWRLQGRFIPHENLVGTISGAAQCDGAAKKAIQSGEEFRPVNRDLMAFLINQVRASSERFDIVYVDFIEQFLAVGDLDLWDVPTGHGVTVPSPGGAVNIPSGDWIVAKTVIAVSSWTDQVATWRAKGPTASIAYLLFWSSAYDHGYRVRIDFTAQTVTLQENNSGAVSDLSSAIFLPDAIVPDIDVAIRVDALAEGSGARMRVRVEGDTVIDYYESSPLNTSGSVGALASGATIEVSYVEVNVLPTEIDRVGLTP